LLSTQHQSHTLFIYPVKKRHW